MSLVSFTTLVSISYITFWRNVADLYVSTKSLQHPDGERDISDLYSVDRWFDSQSTDFLTPLCHCVCTCVHVCVRAPCFSVHPQFPLLQTRDPDL